MILTKQVNSVPPSTGNVVCELAFEGQRKYDLLRWGFLAETLRLFQDKMDASLKGKYVAGDKFVKGKHELFPIPLGEIQSNPALENKNNPGYE